MHLHHRLLALGHSHRRVALVIYAWVSLIAFGAVGATMLPTEVIVPLVAAGLLFVLAATLVPRLRSSRAQHHTGGGTASG